MLAGELYRASDPELQADAAAAKAWMVRYNASLALSPAERRALLAERLAYVGADAVIRPPFFCDYGYILDVVEAVIGAGTRIRPLVQILTADHPRDPELRFCTNSRVPSRRGQQ